MVAPPSELMRSILAKYFNQTMLNYDGYFEEETHVNAFISCVSSKQIDDTNYGIYLNYL